MVLRSRKKVRQKKARKYTSKNSRGEGHNLQSLKPFFPKANKNNTIKKLKTTYHLFPLNNSQSFVHGDHPDVLKQFQDDENDCKLDAGRRMTILSYPIIFSGIKIAQDYKANPETIHIQAPSGREVCCRKGWYSQGYISTNRVNYPGVKATFSRYQQIIACLRRHSGNDDSSVATLLLSYMSSNRGTEHEYLTNYELMRAADMLVVIALVAEAIRDSSAGALFIQTLSNIAKKREGYTWDTFFEKFPWASTCKEGRTLMGELRNPGEIEIKHTPGKRKAAVGLGDEFTQAYLHSRRLSL